jgi:CheY-like chemotaxis protein
VSTAANETLLYVEDDPDHADLVLDTLSRHKTPARIVHVEDGEAALAYLHSHTDEQRRPRLILLDLRLPKVDGFEVLRTVKTTPGLSTIPVVVLTTSSSRVDVARAYADHVNSYLVKPDDYSSLDALLQEVSDYWLCRNEVSAEARSE